jgi:hypothetical protein
MSKRLEPILEKLKLKQTIHNYVESGNSMTPLISHREPVTLAPVDKSKLAIGDIVLSKVAGRFYLHLIKAIQEDRIQIGNNHGHINGWTNRDKVFGIVIEVNGRKISGAVDKVLV